MKIVTHSGYYHIDEVFAVAALLLIYPEAQVIRSRELSQVDAADIAVDVGLVYDPVKMRFDHHQRGGAGVRDNGIPYASFGLIWKHFGEKISDDKEVTAEIEKLLVLAIDAGDNGIMVSKNIYPEVGEYTFKDYIYSLVEERNPSNEYLYQTFIKAVNLAKEVLEREIKSIKVRIAGRQIVKHIFESTEDKSIIILGEELPWKDVLIPNPETFYVIFPDREGDWRVRAVPKEEKGFALKKPLPEEWGGRTSSELTLITGVKDVTFCHPALFIAGAKTQEGALELAKLALNS